MKDNIKNDYSIKSCNIKVQVDLKNKGAAYSETNVIIKKQEGDLEYKVAFEIGAKCLNLSVYTDANGKNENVCPQIPNKYNGTDYYKSLITTIPAEVPAENEIIIQVEFKRDIRVEAIEGFFDQYNYLVGLFHYNERYCEHYSEHVFFKDNHDYPIKIKMAMSPAEVTTTNYEKEVEFRRDNIPEKRYTPLTMVVELGDLKHRKPGELSQPC